MPEEIENETSSGGKTPSDANSTEAQAQAPARAPAAASQPPAGPPAATPQPPAASSAKSGLGVEEVAFSALLLLALGGIAVADFSARSGLSYWLVVIPIFAAVSVFSGWRSARADGKNVKDVLLPQVMHWGALALAVYLIYLLERTGRLNRDDAGLVALLSLSLTTVLAGIHFDRRLALLGALLAVATACAAMVEEFFWILLIPTVAAVAFFVFWQRRKS